MRIREILREGGWSSTVTQGTVITPAIVKKALTVMQKFFNDFNAWNKGVPPVKISHPTGSTAYYEVDPEDKIYGDIDLQVIVPNIPETQRMTSTQLQYYWNKKYDQFLADKNPSYVHPNSDTGHPIVQIAPDAFVQVDIMSHSEELSTWGRFRATPERNVKGILNGYMFAVLGTMMNLSLQYSGVQYREKDGKRIPYSSGKDEPNTLTVNIETFVRDIFDYEYKRITGKDPKAAKIDPLLAKHPGSNIKEVKISNLVNAVKGLARSFEANDMMGKDILAPYNTADDFLAKFLSEYEGKAIRATQNKKMDKAETPEARARAESDRKKIIAGLDMVKQLFAQN